MTTPRTLPLAPAHPGDRARLIVAECFGIQTPTFQGEGPSCGQPALFIRLSRCNLTCARCDTKYTWDWTTYDPRAESTRRSGADLADWATTSPVDLVVITGGEPLIQQRGLIPVVHRLLESGKRIEVETNGTLPPDPALLVEGVTFNVSPKLASFGVDERRSIIPHALDAFAASGRAVFKFVASTRPDLDRIADLADTHHLAPIWVMPEGASDTEIAARTRDLAGAVAARRWNFTTRLHIHAFDGARGR
ncbi:7-carboxy-7-deazaguanine synthase QueE [Amycolatopsis thailandensis]|uniref:7-carboxy-7-deazaguanine synthase n=1 Tax=Amycolatopsis thailandensis TaxID=589330 RepID=A0A229RUW3_9PSEU|nr:7-carboxy-7-deazaguanine synthase QueE [Amycolatopsis thailandensis]OXM50281.1 7-carboxy-7-deazaguanine synthase QueE [Amycolatopsis thailandensis]